MRVENARQTLGGILLVASTIVGHMDQVQMLTMICLLTVDIRVDESRETEKGIKSERD